MQTHVQLSLYKCIFHNNLFPIIYVYFGQSNTGFVPHHARQLEPPSRNYITANVFILPDGVVPLPSRHLDHLAIGSLQAVPIVAGYDEIINQRTHVDLTDDSVFNARPFFTRAAETLPQRPPRAR